jgi:putative sterol carrier protein
MKFLSDEWFTKVDELAAASGDLDVPAQLAGLIININVEAADGAHQMHIDGGKFQRGHSDKGEVTIGLSEDLARKLFIDQDMSAGMQAFMAGEIKIEGDMTKLMAFQTTPMSDKQKALIRQVKEITD